MKTLVSLSITLLSGIAAAQVGDGKADDTGAIQYLLDRQGKVGGIVKLARPAKFYRITRSLLIGRSIGLRFLGSGGEKTRIVMDGDNRPIIAFVDDNTHSVTIQDLTLEYARPQSADENPRSSAIAYLNRTGKSSGSGLYRHVYRNLWIRHAARGFSVLRDKAGDTDSVNPWWGSRWERIVFQNTARSLIDLNLGRTGAPCNVYSEILTMKGGNDGQGAAFVLRGEAIMRAIDIEDWTGQLLYAPCFGYITLIGLHVERHRTGTARNPRLIEVYNGEFDGSGWTISYLPDSSPATVLYLGSGATGNARAVNVKTPGRSVTVIARPAQRT
jgi:hypothetical protein